MFESTPLSGSHLERLNHQNLATPSTSSYVRSPHWLSCIPPVAIAVFLVLVMLLSGCGLLMVDGVPDLTSPAELSMVERPPDSGGEPVVVSQVQATSTATRFATPTPESGGQVLTLTPRRGDVGWWASGDTRTGHLGDSFLYAGYSGDQAFISAIRFDVSRVTRGASIPYATLRLKGLTADRLDSEAGGTWSVQLLDTDAVQYLARADFQEIFNARAAVTLVPVLSSDDLGVNRINAWSLDRASRQWLEQQVLDGETLLIVRISGPAGGEESLFAWDSGHGSSSKGNPPQLVLSIGAPPPTPPPLPTQPVIITTLEPTPANVATAAARVLTATAHAVRYGTPTPLPYQTVLATATPTPVIVTYTSTPANAATATGIAVYATAVALTTGTFTPMPTDALVATATPTPIVITATPTPDNVFTAAARVLTATAQAERYGTPTPLPDGALLVAGMPASLVITFTPTPANAATATANAAYATAVALTTGTFTPVPAHAVTPVIILPTPIPTNVVMAAAQLLTATAQAELVGTATPLVYNAIIASVTPTTLVITSTPTPANGSTAVARVAYATAVALTTGTFTPLPPNVVTATPMPLVVYLDSLTPTAQPTPTPTAAAALPSALAGKVLFLSDREGPTELFALDVASGRLALVTQWWPYHMARDTQLNSPDRTYSLLVKSHAPEGSDEFLPQVYVRDNQFGVERLLQSTANWSYDPVWSPTGNQIAFVSLQPGNDEIYAVNPDGGDLRRLTFNDWEWDKHPSWSPDGTQIVFWSNRGTGRRQLWVMNADGTNQQQLLDSPYNDWDPVWVR